MSHSTSEKAPPIESAHADQLVAVLVELEEIATAARLAIRSHKRSVDDVREWLGRFEVARIRLAAKATAAGL